MERIIQLFPMTPVDFKGLQNGMTEEIPLARAVPVADATEARLVVRVHEKSIGHASSAIDVIARTAAPSVEAPEQDFVSTTNAALASVTSASENLVSDALSDDFGEYVDILVRGKQAGTPGTTDCEAILSAELALKAGPPRRSGNIVPVVTERPFDFSDLGVSTTDSVVVAPAIDVSRFRNGVLVVRAHERDIGSRASITVKAFGVWPSEEQPQTDFIDASEDASVVVAEGSGSLLKTDELAAQFGPYLRVEVIGLQGTSPQTIQSTLSVDLVLKE